MNNARKILAGALSAFMVLSSTTSVLAVADSAEALSPDVKIISVEDEKIVYFNAFTGVVKEINPALNPDGSVSAEKTFVLTESVDGSLTQFIINKDTFWATDASLKAGSVVTGYYDATRPVIMIYPPQYVAEVMVVDLPEGQNVKTDRFDENLLSSDQWLKLNLSDETQILLENGRPFTGELKNRNLVVYYDVTTKSIPAQTTPSKIVVLQEQDDTAELLSELDLQDWASKVPSMSLVVNGKTIQAPAPFAKEDGTVMVPVRAVAEALGFEVKWNNEEKSVTLNKGITFTLFKDYYIYMRTAPITLGTAPDTRGGSTYVPMSFFTEVARMDEAFVKDGQIIINGSAQ
jgi:hypothetical protein